METNYPPNTCAACRDNNFICEFSLADQDTAVTTGCIECMNAGEGCSIPIYDSVMMANGVPTAGAGQRSCFSCAVNHSSCVFPSGTRPLPCLSCMLTEQLWCVIPPPSVVSTSAPPAAYHDYSALGNEDLQLFHGDQPDENIPYLNLNGDEQIGELLYDLSASVENFYPEVGTGDDMLSWDMQFGADSEPAPFVPFEQDMDGQGDIPMAESSLPSPSTPTSMAPTPGPCWTLDLGESSIESSEANELSDRESVPYPAQA